jgi:hypothetical protein
LIKSLTRSQDGLSLSLSPSERATIEHHIHAPAWLSWFESTDTGRFLPEATGRNTDADARGPLKIVGTFVGVALIARSSVDAECERLVGCEETIYGLKSSSFLTTVASVVGVPVALLIPIFGAIVDRPTPHRRSIGMVTAVILVVITGIQIIINTIDWFAILCLGAIGGPTLLVHGAAVFSCLPGLALSERYYNHCPASFNIKQFACQTLYADLVVPISQLTTNTKIQ